MRLGEFIDKYCQDIIKKKQDTKALFDADWLPYDDIIDDIDGTLIKVVRVEGTDPIPIDDILLLNEEDFKKRYSAPVCFEAYKNYLDAITILEGPDALNYIRNMLTAEWKDISKYEAKGGLTI